ncbi:MULTISPECIES: prephenate dehydrogenase [Trueperella]|uniref:Cytidylate kinase n=1 Tax=Trueperella abortisuis TaxID=445930 RepID=A0ABT9PI61_9ACTO|nr:MULTISPECIES: prephenate dehydrogenase [Trueperella]MDP9832403.1 prephenate dehydrogenase [Trueperella abortisuis]MDY5403259.1 prephenate dehydrogenase [Trueperella sp.]
MNDTVLTPSPVLVIGAGLLGTSIALRLRRAGVEVHLEDASPVAAALARDLGAGTLDPVAKPKIVVVAIPPDVTAGVVASALDRFPDAVVTDVASVKDKIGAALEGHPGFDRWVGSHPMAGKERSGAIAADADLFVGRPWVITPNDHTSQAAVGAVRTLAVDMGASVSMLSAAEHDHAVALVSHMPQLMSSLVASALRDAPAQALDLAGQGLRDVTRIAESDPLLWTSIINGNRTEIANVLRGISARLGALVATLDRDSGLDRISSVISDGNKGVARIPGKHGGARASYADVIVLIPDQPGMLGRLFAEIGELGINIEDLEMEHSARQPVGRVILKVNPHQGLPLERGLEQKGWQVVRSENPQPLVIAIDGPSGSGKSTVAKRVARELGLSYLDTGAMYRAATWWAVHEGVDLDDAEAVLASTRSMPLSIDLDPASQRFMCADNDITAAIRTSEVSKVVSKLAVNLDVRAEMVRMQQAIIAEESTPSGHSQGRGIVAEGRDITTVVAPNAPVRVLLTASEEARLARRARENLGTTDQDAIAATRDEVLRRDRDDSTVINFTVAEDGVTTIDSSNLGIDDVVAAVIDLIPEGYRD